MKRAFILALAFVAVFCFANPSFARHPHCGGWGGYVGGHSGFGGGFYSNTCYAGFNSPWVGYGNCNYGGCYSSYGYGYYPGVMVGYGGYYPGYTSYYYGSPYGYYPYNAYYYNPPVFAPAELLYGPVAARRFLGMADPTAPPAPAVALKVTETKKPREASPEYRRKADQFIAQGDMLFREQKYQQAIDRFKTASEMAPDLAEAYWHKGHAYAATNRYELAAAAFRRALAIDPDIRRDGFSLTRLYGDTVMAKASHLEAIAGYVLEHPDSADAFFVLGVFLHYTGEAERAEKFFARAAALAGPDAKYLSGFVPGVVPVKKDEMEI